MKRTAVGRVGGMSENLDDEQLAQAELHGGDRHDEHQESEDRGGETTLGAARHGRHGKAGRQSHRGDRDRIGHGIRESHDASPEPSNAHSGTEDSGNTGTSHRGGHARRNRRGNGHVGRAIGIVIGVLLAAVVALACWFVASALNAKTEVQAAVRSASAIGSQVADGDIAGAKAGIGEFGEHIDATYRQTSNLAWTAATLVPYYGDDVRAVRRSEEHTSELQSQL